MSNNAGLNPQQPPKATQELNSLIQNVSQPQSTTLSQLQQSQAPTANLSSFFSGSSPPNMWNHNFMQQLLPHQQPSKQLLEGNHLVQLHAPSSSNPSTVKPYGNPLASLRGLMSMGGSFASMNKAAGNQGTASQSSTTSATLPSNMSTETVGTRNPSVPQPNFSTPYYQWQVGQLLASTGTGLSLPNAAQPHEPSAAQTSNSESRTNPTSTLAYLKSGFMNNKVGMIGGNMNQPGGLHLLASNAQLASNGNNVNGKGSNEQMLHGPVNQLLSLQQLRNPTENLMKLSSPVAGIMSADKRQKAMEQDLQRQSQQSDLNTEEGKKRMVEEQMQLIQQFREKELQRLHQLNEEAYATLKGLAPNHKRGRVENPKPKKVKKPKNDASKAKKKPKYEGSEIRIDSFALYKPIPGKSLKREKKKAKVPKVPKPYPAKKLGETNNIALCPIPSSLAEVDGHLEKFSGAIERSSFLNVCPFGPVGIAIQVPPKTRRTTKVRPVALKSMVDQVEPHLKIWKNQPQISDLLTKEEQNFMIAQYRRLLTNAIQLGVYEAFRKDIESAPVLAGKEITTETSQTWTTVQLDEMVDVPSGCEIKKEDGSVDHQESFFGLDADHIFCREEMTALDFVRLFEMTGDHADWMNVCRSLSRPKDAQDSKPTRVTVSLNSFRAVQKYIGVAACRKRIEKEKFGVLVLPVYVRFRSGCISVSGSCSIVLEKDLPSVLRVTDSRMRKATKQKMKGDAALAALSGVPLETVAGSATAPGAPSTLQPASDLVPPVDPAKN